MMMLNTRGPPFRGFGLAEAFPRVAFFCSRLAGAHADLAGENPFSRFRPSNQRLPAALAGIDCRPGQQIALFYGQKGLFKR